MTDNKVDISKLKKTIQHNLTAKFNIYIDERKKKDPKHSATYIYGEIANECGVSEDTVSRWKRGSQFPDKIEYLIYLTTKFDCTLDELLNGFYLTKQDKKELEKLNFSEKAALEIIENNSKEKVQERAEIDCIKKMNFDQEEVDKISAQNKEPKPLFNEKQVLPKIKYSDMLNYIIMQNMIKSLMLNKLDEIKSAILNNINTDKFQEFNEKIMVKHYISEKNRKPELNKEQYENVFRNIKKELPNTISGELEKMEQIMKNEYTEFIHKAFIDMFLIDNK